MRVTLELDVSEGNDATALQGKHLYSECSNVEKSITQIVKHCSIKELFPIIRGYADFDAVIYSDGRSTYVGLVSLHIRDIIVPNMITTFLQRGLIILSASREIGLFKSGKKALILQSNEKREIQRKRNGQDGQAS